MTSKSPRNHRFISEREREYILDATKDGISSSGAPQVSVHSATRHVDRLAHTFFVCQKTPWLAILKSKSFWGLVLAHSTSNFGTYLFLTQLPTYMKEVLKFDIKSVSVATLTSLLSTRLSTCIGNHLVSSRTEPYPRCHILLSGFSLLHRASSVTSSISQAT